MNLNTLINNYQNNETIEELRAASATLGNFLGNSYRDTTIDETISQMSEFGRIGYVYPNDAPSYYLNSNLQDAFLVNCSDGYFFISF